MSLSQASCAILPRVLTARRLLPVSGGVRKLSTLLAARESRSSCLQSALALSRPAGCFPTQCELYRHQTRSFRSESDFHSLADETLEDIQDAVDGALEDKGVAEFEVTLASGVLTLVFPPHGTWVINKQTPNRQLWWSSPISGPRRYEYENGDWVFTRDESHSMTLKQALQEELSQIYDVELDL